MYYNKLSLKLEDSMKKAALAILFFFIIPEFVYPKVIKTIPYKKGDYTYQSLMFLKNTSILAGQFDNTKLNKIFIFFDDPSELWEVKARTMGMYDSGYNILSHYPNIFCVVYEKDNAQYLRLIDKIYGPYTSVMPPTFAADTSYFWFRYTLGTEHYVFANGKTYGPFQEMIEFFKYALDNPSRFVFAFKKNSKIYVRYSDQVLGPYPSVEPFISPDGEHTAVVYASPKKMPGFYIEIDDAIHGPYKNAVFHAFSPDNKGYWYTYQKMDGSGVMVVDNTEFDQLPGAPGGVVFSKQNHKFTFSVRGNDGWYIYYENKFYGPYSDLKRPVFSDDGSTMAYVYVMRKGNKETFYVWINGKVSGPFNYISNFDIAPDGKSLVYIEEQLNGDDYIVYGDQRFGPCFIQSDSGDNLVFSPDGKHLAHFYWTLDKKQQKKPAYMKYDDLSYGPFYNAYLPSFTPDGKHFYFTFNNKPGDESLWIDGKEISPGAFFIPDVRFSPDSMKFVFRIEKAETDDQTYFYYGGKTYGPYPWGTDFNFSTENHLMVAYLDKKKGLVVIEDLDIQ